MAKIHKKTHQSSPKPSIFLCCFGSSSQKKRTSNMASDHTQKPKILHWFSWRRIRKAKSAIKTVPLLLDTSLSDHHKHKADQLHPTKIKSKPKSKSQKPSLITSQTPAPNLQPPCQTPSTAVPDVKPNHTSPPTRQRHNNRPHANDQDDRSRSHGVASPEDNTRQYSVSLPALKRLVIREPSSSTSIRPDQTTMNQAIGWENAKRAYDPVVGMCMVVVTLVIMIVWGRLCAILCTSAWLYFVPRFRTSTEENDSRNSKEVDLDSEVYKKRVILEGLLERNHRSTL